MYIDLYVYVRRWIEIFAIFFEGMPVVCVGHTYTHIHTYVCVYIHTYTHRHTHIFIQM
jgi:hypothetical protein